MFDSLGLRLPPEFAAKEILECAQLAEDCGFTSLWLPEVPFGRNTVALLSAIAHATKKIRLGTGILNIYTRSPLLLATSAATLDEVSDGRTLLGLGTSTPPLLQRAGVEFERPIARMRDYVTLISKLLSQDRVDYSGRTFKVHGTKLGFKPFRQKIPIYISALNPQMLALTGQIADGLLSNTQTPASLKESISAVRKSAQKSGRDPSHINIACYLHGCVSDDLASAKQACKRLVSSYVLAPFYKEFFARIFAEETKLANQLFAKGEKQKAFESIPDRMAEAITFTGTPADARARIDDYVRAGLETPIFAPLPIGTDHVRNVKAQISSIMN